MIFSDFEQIVSYDRLHRYVISCKGDRQKALTLYRFNLQLSEALYSVVSCFEIALRNAIDKRLTEKFGDDWLRDSVLENGIFAMPVLHKTNNIIRLAYFHLKQKNSYSHSKLLAEMEFGIWKYMFSPVQYKKTGQTLLGIFSKQAKIISTKAVQSHIYVQ